MNRKRNAIIVLVLLAFLASCTGNRSAYLQQLSLFEEVEQGKISPETEKELREKIEQNKTRVQDIQNAVEDLEVFYKMLGISFFLAGTPW
jgi:TolA-binding protein